MVNNIKMPLYWWFIELFAKVLLESFLHVDHSFEVAISIIKCMA